MFYYYDQDQNGSKLGSRTNAHDIVVILLTKLLEEGLQKRSVGVSPLGAPPKDPFIVNGNCDLYGFVWICWVV